MPDKELRPLYMDTQATTPLVQKIYSNFLNTGKPEILKHTLIIDLHLYHGLC